MLIQGCPVAATYERFQREEILAITEGDLSHCSLWDDKVTKSTQTKLLAACASCLAHKECVCLVMIRAIGCVIALHCVIAVIK